MEIEEFEQRLHDAEVRLARLKALYEQWFQGIERIEPQIARKELERMLEALKREQPRNTALRFRCQQLSARYGTYGIYWGRIAKQIEEGTYRRDLQRARARIERERAREAQKTYEVDVDLDDLGGGADDGFGDSDLDAIFGALTTSPAPSLTPAAPAAAAATPRREPTSFPRAREEAAAASTGPATGKTAARAGGGYEEEPTSSTGITIGRMRPTPSGGVREEAGAHSRARQDGPPTGPRPIAPPPPPPTRGASPAPSPTAPRVAPPTPGSPAQPSRAAPPPPPGAPAPARVAAPQAATGPDLKALYDRYVDARRRNNERVDNVKFEVLQQSVEKMMPKLREKHGNKAIEFDVVLTDGKVGLKPKVRG